MAVGVATVYIQFAHHYSKHSENMPYGYVGAVEYGWPEPCYWHHYYHWYGVSRDIVKWNYSNLAIDLILVFAMLISTAYMGIYYRIYPIRTTKLFGLTYVIAVLLALHRLGYTSFVSVRGFVAHLMLLALWLGVICTIYAAGLLAVFIVVRAAKSILKPLRIRHGEGHESECRNAND